MNKRQFTAARIAILASTIQAQTTPQSPRLVVNIAIDQLCTDYMEAFNPYFGTEGFRKIMSRGKFYENAAYTFAPVD